jgi:hypothetical protein
MNFPRFFLGILGIFFGFGAEARAHFLFIRIGPAAEAGRAAEVFFSEKAEAGDPRFVAKIAGTRLWVQQTPGKFKPLRVVKAADRLRAHLPVSGSLAVIGSCQYGVLARPKQTPFLLCHYPKAVAGKADELNRLKPCAKVPLEIVANVQGGQITFQALRQGKPLPRAVFHVVHSDLRNETLTADARGQATWKPAPDRYAVYTRLVTKENGTAGGAKYEEVRAFATLAFTWPLVGKGPDPKAVALFEEALATRAQWHKGFPGFTAHIKGKVDGRAFAGTVTVQADGGVKLKVNDPVARAWARDQLASIVLHRGTDDARSSSGKRAKPVLRFADAEEDHPLGRLLVFEGGRFASSYRVKDRQIMVVNRNTGRRHMTITVLDNIKNREGRFLPRSYTVQFWDAATGQLQRTETVRDGWKRVGSWDLPAEHTVTSASGAGLAVRSFTLSKHLLLKGK